MHRLSVNRRSLGKLAAVGVSLASFAALTGTATAASTVPKLNTTAIAPKQCALPGAKEIVNVHFTLTNDYDSGVAGNNWANDTIHRHLRMWQEKDGRYCGIMADSGTFVTFAGTSPSGNGTVTAGVTGVIDGGRASNMFHGNRVSAYPAHGNLGTFDLHCDVDPQCGGAHPTFGSYVTPTDYFTQDNHWGWIYRAGRHGTWLNRTVATPATSPADNEPRTRCSKPRKTRLTATRTAVTQTL